MKTSRTDDSGVRVTASEPLWQGISGSALNEVSTELPPMPTRSNPAEYS